MLNINNSEFHGAQLCDADTITLGHNGSQEALRIITARSDYQPTPLYSMPALASSMGIGSLYIKDESSRFGLGSFKALGGAFAVMKIVQEEASRKLRRNVEPEHLLSDEVRRVAEGITFVCATDGNHGRSVAQGAKLVGANVVVLVHQGVSNARVDAIRKFGARIKVIAGNYDDAVKESLRLSEQSGWILLSDTSWPGYERIPSLVMQGYTVMTQEILGALPAPPTHIFLQAGVGGFAAAIAGSLSLGMQGPMPHVTVVEPIRAACLFASSLAGSPKKIDSQESTIMAMLECYEPSHVAFRILQRVADAFLTINDEEIPPAMRRLARPTSPDHTIISGESGCAGLAGLIVAISDPAITKSFKIDSKSRVLVVNTEGATDKDLYSEIIAEKRVMESISQPRKR